ncbi:MAG TPA: LPXTG cell wall anchor domain-containing protein, partial [Corynebacterium sp.]|nr:LPXTG cell wall anchor domain-containing protein [Corynebacterium sp.]
ASPNVYTIDNVQQPPFELPLTGGIGTMGFSIAGLALLALAGASYLLIRQRRQN